ncbi:MAG: glycosyltransferase family 2 protein [Labilithrix sp.]|nr:glycosyltransferase family 2 protein [Labilithrix sp.]MCW5831513.1 glycosyltransferase family 2 protein [Labilithrix sp.]
MLNDRAVVVVVPAYQEEAHVGGVIASMPRFVDHVVVVDDASVDRTGAVARASGDGRVRVLRHPARRGVGAAIATGYAAALELTAGPDDAIAVMAGDGQMAPEDLERVVRPIVSSEADYVKGDRFGDPSVRDAMGLPRWIGGQVFSRLTSLAIGQAISDSQCGFTAISRRAIVALDLPGLWPSFGYPNDLLGQLSALDARIAEVPVQPIYGSEISKLRLRHLPPIFFLIARAATRRGRRGRRRTLRDVTRPDDAEKKELRRAPTVSS